MEVIILGSGPPLVAPDRAQQFLPKIRKAAAELGAMYRRIAVSG